MTSLVVCLALVVAFLASSSSGGTLTKTISEPRHTGSRSETADATLTGTSSINSDTRSFTQGRSVTFETISRSPTRTVSWSQDPRSASVSNSITFHRTTSTSVSNELPTASRTVTKSWSITVTLSRSVSSARSETRSYSVTMTKDGRSLTLTSTAVHTSSATRSRGTRSATQSSEVSTSRTLMPTSSRSLVSTPTETVVDSHSRLPSETESSSATYPRSNSVTETRSFSTTISWTPSTSSSFHTATRFPTETFTETLTFTREKTQTRSRSQTKSTSFTFSTTATSTMTASVTIEYTNWTIAPSETRSQTPSHTSSPTHDPTASFSPTASRSISFSASSTISEEKTRSETGTIGVSESSTPSSSSSSSPSLSTSKSNSKDPSLSHSNSASPSQNPKSRSFSPTNSWTSSFNQTMTFRSRSPTRSLSPSPSASSEVTATDTGTDDLTLTATLTLTPAPTRTQSFTVVYRDSLASTWSFALQWFSDSANDCMLLIIYIGSPFVGLLIIVVFLTIGLMCLRFPIEVDTFQEVPMWRSLFVLHTYFSVFWPCHYRCAYLHCLALVFHFNFLMMTMNGILKAFAATTNVEVALVVIFSCTCANATRPVINSVLFHHSVDPRDEPLRRREIAKYVEDVEAQKAGDKDVTAISKHKLETRAANDAKEKNSTSAGRGKLTSPPTTTKDGLSSNRGDFDLEFDIDFEDFPKPATAQSSSRARVGSSGGSRNASSGLPKPQSAAEALATLQSFVFDFHEDLPDIPAVVPVAITDAIDAHSFGDFTPIDIGLQTIEDNGPVQVDWIPITVHGLWISFGLILSTVLIILGNFYISGSLQKTGKCNGQNGYTNFGSLTAIVVVIDVFVFQSAFIGCVWFFRSMTSGEADECWSELHPYDGEWRIAKRQRQAQPMPDLNLDDE